MKKLYFLLLISLLSRFTLRAQQVDSLALAYLPDYNGTLRELARTGGCCLAASTWQTSFQKQRWLRTQKYTTQT